LAEDVAFAAGRTADEEEPVPAGIAEDAPEPKMGPTALPDEAAVGPALLLLLVRAGMVVIGITTLSDDVSVTFDPTDDELTPLDEVLVVKGTITGLLVEFALRVEFADIAPARPVPVGSAGCVNKVVLLVKSCVTTMVDVPSSCAVANVGTKTASAARAFTAFIARYWAQVKEGLGGRTRVREQVGSEA